MDEYEADHEESTAWQSATGEGLRHLGDEQSQVRWGKLALKTLDPDEAVLAAVVCDDSYDPHRALVVTDRRVIHWGVSVLLPQHVVREIPAPHVTGAHLEDRWITTRLVVRTSTGRDLCVAVERSRVAQRVVDILNGSVTS